MSDQFDPDDKLETVDDVCDALAIGRTTFYELVKTGRLGAVKLNGATRVRRADRLRFMATLPAVSTTDAAA